ncbi:MAG TPA: hypothetical protein VJ783_10990 [Pirellulales bacterium]|nr:hypothetical protein [Pirellulales bacterium]
MRTKIKVALIGVAGIVLGTLIPRLFDLVEGRQQAELSGALEVQHSLKPVAPAPPALDVCEIRTLCKRCPSDHTTFRIVLRNNSDRTIRVTAGKLNLGECGYLSYEHSDIGPRWTSCEEMRRNKATVVMPQDAVQGASIDFALTADVPPDKTREVIVTVRRSHPEGKSDEYFHAVGSIIFVHDTGEAATPDVFIAGYSAAPAPVVPPSRGDV